MNQNQAQTIHSGREATAPAPNRNYKDSIFRLLFRDRKNLLSLYNAVNGTSYRNPDELTIVTLENAVYMSIKNDQAFLLNGELNLYEHQSSRNPNMPLRDLFYAASEYQKLTASRTLYSSAPAHIPTPNFLVFYNGTEEAEERKELRLSDLFENPTDHPSLELIVTQYNLNAGCNEELKEACRTLKEYMQYVERVRLYAEQTDLPKAVERAVDECIREGILSDFLRQNRAEAIMTSIFEYDEVREKELIRKAEYEVGVQAGIHNQLKEKVQIKLQKGKQPETIADELEESLPAILALIQEINAGKGTK